MKLKKVLNNNVVIAEDDVGEEHIVVGGGLAFQLKKGDEIPNEKIEKTFSSNESKNQLHQLVNEFPRECLDLTDEIVMYAEGILKMKLYPSIYITLSDHIHFVTERVQQGLLMKNSMKWDIQRYYPTEYNIGKKAVECIEDEFDIELNDDEAASIALHIVNAEADNENIHKSIEEIHLLDSLIQIIQYNTHLIIDDTDLNYQRMITHMKFFVQRVMSKRQLSEANPLYEVVKSNYPKAYKVTEKVKNFIETKTKYAVSDDEMTYLTIHIQRLLSREQNS